MYLGRTLGSWCFCKDIGLPCVASRRQQKQKKAAEACMQRACGQRSAWCLASRAFEKHSLPCTVSGVTSDSRGKRRGRQGYSIRSPAIYCFCLQIWAARYALFTKTLFWRLALLLSFLMLRFNHRVSFL